MLPYLGEQRVNLLVLKSTKVSWVPPHAKCWVRHIHVVLSKFNLYTTTARLSSNLEMRKVRLKNRPNWGPKGPSPRPGETGPLSSKCAEVSPVWSTYKCRLWISFSCHKSGLLSWKLFRAGPSEESRKFGVSFRVGASVTKVCPRALHTVGGHSRPPHSPPPPPRDLVGRPEQPGTATCGKPQKGWATPLLLRGDKMCPPRRLPGSWQQVFFLGLSPPSSCPFILSLPSEKAEKDHTVGRLVHAPEGPKYRRGGWEYCDPWQRLCLLGSRETHSTIGRSERGRDSTFTTGAGLFQSGLQPILGYCEVIKPRSLGVGPWSGATAHGSSGWARTRTVWGCKVLRVPVPRAAQPKVSNFHSYQQEAPVRQTNCTVSCISLRVILF